MQIVELGNRKWWLGCELRRRVLYAAHRMRSLIQPFVQDY